MKVVIKAPLMADKIKELFDNKVIDDLSFTFLEKQAMEMSFLVEGDNLENVDVVTLVKNTIKNTEFGRGIYFSVNELN